MSFLELSDLANNGDFKKRIEAAAIRVSLGLLVNSDATQAIKELALQVGRSSSSYTEMFAKATVYNPETSVTDTSTDADIEYTVGVVFPKLAGG